MLGEKKSFRRFLAVYIFSSLFLLALGGYSYYKMSYELLLNSTVSQMKKEIDIFIQTNKKTRFLKTNIEPNYLGIPMAIYIDKKYKIGNFKVDDFSFEKEIFLKKEKLYYIDKEHKKWADIYLITYKNIGDALTKLQESIVLFLLLSTFFIIGIAFVLGKIFLKPMKETLESLENFIADATHEINTPISNILINIELSKELNPVCGESDEFRKIESSAFRVSKIFKDLSYIKLGNERSKVLESISIDELVYERIDFFATFIDAKQLKIGTKIQSLKITIDKEDALRIIDNLLSNAIKYTKEESTIEINVNQNCFEVVNNGIIQNKEKVMQKFVRENSNEGGFGLGLYIVQKICSQYGFHFVLSSTENKVSSKICFI